LQLGVDAVYVVVVDVFSKQLLKVILVQNDHVIEKLVTSAANP
jgi:hypothetical protein